MWYLRLIHRRRSPTVADHYRSYGHQALQPVTGETLNRQRSAFFDVRVCHPNADSFREMTPQQIYKQHETEKKRQYSSRVMEIEHGTFTPLVFTTTGGMADECRRYHCRLAELISTKKGEPYAATISWIRTKVSFAILRGALLCLRGSRTPRRRQFTNIRNNDLELDNGLAGLN